MISIQLIGKLLIFEIGCSISLRFSHQGVFVRQREGLLDLWRWVIVGGEWQVGRLKSTGTRKQCAIE